MQPSGDALQVEKVQYEDAVAIMPSDVQSVGTSLGSFSVSSELLAALLSEFDTELTSKSGKFDSDPHFWMPMTLSRQAYIGMMAKKGVEEAESSLHWDRMERFKTGFMASAGGSMGMFGCVDTGTECYWWDYGQLKFFSDNNLLVTHNNPSAAALRTFLGIQKRQQHNTLGSTVAVHPDAVVLNCNIQTGSIGPSAVLVGIHAAHVNLDNCVAMNCTAKSISGSTGVLYNVVDESTEGIIMEEDAVRADVFVCEKKEGNKKYSMRSSISIDGGKAWKKSLFERQPSFEAIYKLNGGCCIMESQLHAQEEHTRVSDLIARQQQLSQKPATAMPSNFLSWLQCCK